MNQRQLSSESSGTEEPRHPVRRSRFLVVVVAGLIGGAAAWLLIESYGTPLEPTAEINALYLKRLGGITAEEEARLGASERALFRRNTAVAFFWFGLTVGGMIGLGSGLGLRSATRAVVGLLAGTLLGGVAGALGGYAAAAAGGWAQTGTALDLAYIAILMHLIGWLIVSAGISLAVAAVVRRTSTAFGAFVALAFASLLAAGLYPVVAALFFQMDNAELAVPSGKWNRLAWVELAAGLMAIATARTLARRSGSESPAATAGGGHPSSSPVS